MQRVENKPLVDFLQSLCDAVADDKQRQAATYRRVNNLLNTYLNILTPTRRF